MTTDTSLAFAHPEARAKATAGPQPLDRLSLRDHVVLAEIGAFQQERGVRQRLRFNVVVEVREHPAHLADDVDRILSYDRITEAIAASLAADRLDLLETLAERVADRLLDEPQAMRVFVRVEKLDRGPGALGVEIVRSHDDPTLPPDVAPDKAATDGAAPDGALKDGALKDGALKDGALKDGALKDGAAKDGAAKDGSVVDGIAMDGAVTPEGLSSRDGAAIGGTVKDGAKIDGAAIDGAAVGGTHALVLPAMAQKPVVAFLDNAAIAAGGLGATLDALEASAPALILTVGLPDGPRPRTGHATTQARIDLLAIEQNAWALAGRDPRCTVVATRTEIDWAIRHGRTILWAPSKMVLDAAQGPQSHDPVVMALWLAETFAASRFVLHAPPAPPAESCAPRADA